MKDLIWPSIFRSFDLRAFFTTKLSLNKEKTITIALSKKFNISGEKIYLPVQKHTGIVHKIEEHSGPVVADAVITSQKNLLIGVIVADCVPLLLYDRRNKVIGAVHAGWRGTGEKILINTIDKMEYEYRSKPEDMLLAIGPSIRGCSYEVDRNVKDEVFRATGDGDYYIKKGEKYFLDLSIANKIQALNRGIPETAIWRSDDCTFCDPDRFFSYRYSSGTKGRQGGFIGMW